jgi:probable rRNA maturation factor
MLQALKLPHAELSVLLCDDRTIHALNRKHRRRDRPTDVLAFAMQEATAGTWQVAVLGDVVVSLDTARRQAAARRRSLWDEVMMLIAHGLLHLLGFDHRTSTEERHMAARTDVLCAAARVRRARRG